MSPRIITFAVAAALLAAIFVVGLSIGRDVRARAFTPARSNHSIVAATFRDC